ncbi:hypothetical protein SCP_0302380 [Sparassis crispa]|uniref:Uncharacterized protein n=1 Tax=Sparassis crispa TaxID=139825 RepID=A0A401GEJ5_9APHY|nr:hypothetical protein SCP_0302380 [Sparassis crispa]GBE80523.1 hypothetical protein SCP_0302380 [Sparassis crispa]
MDKYDALRMFEPGSSIRCWTRVSVTEAPAMPLGAMVWSAPVNRISLSYIVLLVLLPIEPDVGRRFCPLVRPVHITEVDILN